MSESASAWGKPYRLCSSEERRQARQAKRDRKKIMAEKAKQSEFDRKKRIEGRRAEEHDKRTIEKSLKRTFEKRQRAERHERLMGAHESHRAKLGKNDEGDC